MFRNVHFFIESYVCIPSNGFNIAIYFLMVFFYDELRSNVLLWTPTHGHAKNKAVKNELPRKRK